MSEPLLLTGPQRGGTTLLEKLLAAHPQVSLLSQPLPLLLVETKREFLRQRGFDDPMPLGTLFHEQRYRRQELDGYLDELWLSAERLQGIFRAMAAYSGQYTRFAAETVVEAIASRPPGPGFAATLAHLYRALGHRRQATIAGGKEMFGEEYLPHLLDRGWKGVVILRDPRDVIASLRSGDGPRHAGAVKPTLLDVRNWRRSVAVALELTGRPGFVWVRYEDLVADPEGTLREVTDALSVDAITLERQRPLVDQGGKPWSGNSSHGPLSGVETRSVGRWRELLSPSTARYVEATCLPELRCLGYEVELSPPDAVDVLSSYQEPCRSDRDGMAGYSTTPDNVTTEVERLRWIDEPPGEMSRFWFVSPQAHRRLQRAMAS
jgi:hypothetical protein